MKHASAHNKVLCARDAAPTHLLVCVVVSPHLHSGTVALEGQALESVGSHEEPESRALEPASQRLEHDPVFKHNRHVWFAKVQRL
jgi:hypothetical protein